MGVDNRIIESVIRMAAVSLLSYFAVKWMLDFLEPSRKERQTSQKKARGILTRLGVDKDIKFNEHELLIASSLIESSDINVGWSNIAGLDDVLDELIETVVLPIQSRKFLISMSSLMLPPKGILLYGPPGCGKTLIAKATAREAGCNFINVDVSVLTDKWYGESQKLAVAIFTLAAKIQPCIIFIDEIDSLLRTRTSNDHEATAMIKAQFMLLWDGLETDPNSTVVVMGATNRPDDMDAAIRRRMPSTFHIGRPNTLQRQKILGQILKEEELDFGRDNETEAAAWVYLAETTNGFSGSDLRELCRTAAIYRLKDHDLNSCYNVILRPIEMADLHKAFQKMGKGGLRV